MNNNYIKFTFDINKAINNISNKRKVYSEPFTKMCMAKYDKLITQKELFDVLDNNKLTENAKIGLCIITSVYNAYPFIFNYNIQKLKMFVEDNINRITQVQYVCNAVNKQMNSNLLYAITSLAESFKLFENSVSKNCPTVNVYRFGPLNNLSHAITLFGYDRYYVYYKENSESNFLFMSLLDYLIQYYRLNAVSNDNIYYNDIIELLNSNNNDDIIKIGKQIIGYDYIATNGLSRVKKDFLTNGVYFYDIVKMIAYNKNISMDEDNFGAINFNFTGLLEKLKDIGQYI